MKRKKIISLILMAACLLTCLLGFETPNVEAKDNFISGFSQTVFNQENGLGSAEVNCILQTASGYMWIGTDGGLYRYNGSEFKSFNLWETDKDDVYFINDLFQDSTGRLWVSTNNYGLFYIKGSTVQHFSDDYYNGVKCVNDVIEGDDGTIYVATAYGLYTVNEDGIGLSRYEDMPVHNIKELAFTNGFLWGIYNSNMIFSMKKGNRIQEIASQTIVNEELSCITATKDGIVYVGTIGSSVLRMTSIQFYQVLNSGVEGINSVKVSGSRCYVLSDNGVGFFNAQEEFHKLNDLTFDTYFSSMVVDYEGNIWLASSRFGILLLSVSKFDDYNVKYGIQPYSTNCVLESNKRKYFGTDEGLVVIDENNQVVEGDPLVKALDGIGIKDIMEDSQGNLWISTLRKYGVVKYSPKGELTTFGRNKNLLTNLVNCTYELADGSIAVGTEEGISIIGTDNKVTKNYSYASGLVYSNILCLFQGKDGKIYAGSDGGGLYVIDTEDAISNYTMDDGLTSNVVSCIVQGELGIWIGTDNGLTFFKDSLRSISNVDFSNNIYDIIFDHAEDGTQGLWLIGSKGILHTSEKELIGTEGLSSRYLSTGDGLSKTMTINAKELLSNDDNLYLCCSNGVMVLDTKNFRQNTVAPRITVSEINVDGKSYYFDQIGGSLTVPANTQRINISFAVLSFVGRDNLKASYMLEGFDETATIISGNETMQAIYTNLDGGTYTFNVSAENGDQVESNQSISFVIEKEFSIYERKEFRLAVVIFVLILVLILTIVLIRIIRRIRGQNKEIEKLLSEHEVAVRSSSAKNDFLANMSNDIKIPINAIVSIAEEIKKDKQGDAELLDKMDSIISTSGDILGRVDSTIHLARLDSGRESVVNAPYSITTLVCDISDHVINQIEDRPVRFLVDLSEQMPDILVGDFDKIKNTLEIITDNAVKFTKEGTITLSVDAYSFRNTKNEEKVNLIFSVSDTGVGIREERLEHIFEVYNIADNKKQTGYSGSGISLAIARKLVDIMGGEIDVESTYGAGSTFTVSLVQEKPEQDVVTGSVDINMVERVSKEEAGKMWAPEVSALLVDDVEISRKVAMGVMKQMEIKTDAASSGVSAIDMVMNHRYDIIFMNVAMPVMSGLDALREMRDLADESLHSIPIIGMTEDAIGEDSEKLIQEGFHDVIIKPMDIQSLANMIKKFIPQSKIKYRSNDMMQYILESRYKDGLNSLSGNLDVAGTLERIGGNIDVYNKLITTFYVQNQSIPEELHPLLQTNYRGFRNRIHNIRMGCMNIGAQELCETLIRMEAAINIGNRDYVKNILPGFTDSLSELLELLQKYLQFVKEQQGILDNEGAAKNTHTSDSAAEEASEEKLSDSVDDQDDSVEENEFVEGDVVFRDDPEPVVGDNAEDEILLTEGVAEPVDEEEVRVIDIDDLSRIQEALERNEIELAVEIYNEMTSHKYGADDTGFLSALGDSILAKDIDQIRELVSTYLALKCS